MLVGVNEKGEVSPLVLRERENTLVGVNEKEGERTY